MRDIKALLVLIFVICFVLSPVVTPGFPGFTADQFPVPQIDPPIQPTGWTFAIIWTLIYTWLLVMAVFGLWKRPRTESWQAHRLPLILNMVIGMFWIPMANISPEISMVMLWVMLATALLALKQAPLTDRYWLQAPLGLYTGWLTAACAVGTAIVVTGHGAAPVQLVHAAFLLIAAIFALWVARADRGLPFYVAGLIWASFGIVCDNLQAGRTGFATLSLVILLVLAAVEWQAIRRFRAIPN